MKDKTNAKKSPITVNIKPQPTLFLHPIATPNPRLRKKTPIPVKEFTKIRKFISRLLNLHTENMATDKMNKPATTVPMLGNQDLFTNKPSSYCDT